MDRVGDVMGSRRIEWDVVGSRRIEWEMVVPSSAILPWGCGGNLGPYVDLRAEYVLIACSVECVLIACSVECVLIAC